MQYLYLIKCQQFFKIGIANDVQNRLAQLSTGNPFDLEVLAVYGFENANSVEAVLHQRFANSRKRGEWFELDSQHIDLFHQICQLLEGTANTLPTVGNEDIEDAENVLDEFDQSKWRVEVKQNGRYFQWRERRRNGKVRYGGKFSELPKERQEEYYRNRKN